MSYTIIIIAITCIISLLAFSNESLSNKLILWPRYMDNPAQYYRLLTSGFIHADWMHLLFNMFTIYSFGTNMEYIFAEVSFREMYVVMYITGIIISSLPSFINNRNNSYYRSLGASGGVSAIVFANIYYTPWAQIYLFFFPMPAILFAVVYLAYTAYMARRGGDNINHSAHFIGSVYGIVFAFLLDPSHGRIFIEQISRIGGFGG